ncbi:hypothetical protein Goarm_012659 [Gossypium armourianum]|uniref:Reverse transcriptase zinc-binding domain-containing protein n=1 Tax=Gossypium armourianum TaxID=34283 RepID=A0A7J9J0M9_9ROSI|nr:hypothetical protein [Gossypium armourianum]
MWALNVPSKIHIHMWRVTNEFVPTLQNLRARKLVVNTLYPECRAKEETVSHLFRDCIFTQQVLRELGVINSTTNRESNWKKWLALEFENYSNEACKIRAISFRAFWYNHNKIYHEGIRERAHEIMGFINAYCLEITQIGIIAQNKEGLVMASCTYPWENILDLIMAYARAYLEANKAAHGMALEGRIYENPQYWMEEVSRTVEGLVNRVRNGGDMAVNWIS